MPRYGPHKSYPADLLNNPYSGNPLKVDGPHADKTIRTLGDF